MRSRGGGPWLKAGLLVVVTAIAAVILGVVASQSSRPARGGQPPVGAAQKLEIAAHIISSSVPPGIVRAFGTHFVLNGQPWRFVGYDDYRLPSVPADGAYVCGGPVSDAGIDTEFRQMAAEGVTVVRTWFFQSYVASGSWRPFDRILHAAARYGIRIIPVLGNQWGTCETYDHSAAQYKPRSWYDAGYLTQHSYGLPLTYYAYALEVATRYRGDPTIAFWQLVNEAEDLESYGGGCDEHAAALALHEFADRMARAIKAVDPDHLVSLGTIGGTQCGADGADYQLVNSGAVDVCEYHDYQSVLAAPEQNRCSAIGKPLFAGERGLLADLGSGTVTGATLAERAALFERDAQEAFAADGCQGYLVWSWTDAASSSYDIGPGDPTRAVMTKVARAYATSAAVYAAVSRAPSAP